MCATIPWRAWQGRTRHIAMPLNPAWTREEFETVLENNLLSAVRLAEMLPRRSVGSIGTIRLAIHQFHLEGDCDLLTPMMRERLANPGEYIACPLCGERLRAR